MEEGPEIFPRMSNASVGRTCGNIEAYFDLSFKIFSSFFYIFIVYRLPFSNYVFPFSMVPDMSGSGWEETNSNPLVWQYAGWQC